MDGPSYDGLIEQWKVDLIRSCARRMGFPRHEIDDILQDIALDLLAFKYDEQNANGAKESTALHALIMNRLRNRRRACQREQAAIARFQQLVPQRTMTDDVPFQRAVDVRATVSDLPLRDQRICHSLAENGSIDAIRKTVGCGWRTVSQAIGRLRRRFHEMGLNEWLGQ